MAYQTQSPDTPRDIEEMLFDAYRRMSAREKLERVGRLGRLVKSVVLGDLRARHPEADERELELRYAARTLGRQTMLTALGWALDESRE